MWTQWTIWYRKYYDCGSWWYSMWATVLRLMSSSFNRTHNPFMAFTVSSNFCCYQHIDTDIHGCCCTHPDCLLFHPKLLRAHLETTEAYRICYTIADLLAFYGNYNGTVNDSSLFRTREVRLNIVVWFDWSRNDLQLSILQIHFRFTRASRFQPNVFISQHCSDSMVGCTTGARKWVGDILCGNVFRFGKANSQRICCWTLSQLRPSNHFSFELFG